jgi:cytosine/adenosine deaminase-related metal-dependent hydrolase
MRFIQADQIFNGKEFLNPETVLVLDPQGVLKDLVSAQHIDSLKIEKFDGIFTPGFANAHCHLELSHLHGLLPQHSGLPEFAKQVIIKRNVVSKEEIAEHSKAADKDMWLNGIVAVGDISNQTDSFFEKTSSNIFYHTFIELIGLNPAMAENVFVKGLTLMHTLKEFDLNGSFAAHAPYSSSKLLIEKIVDYNLKQNLSLSIHNQESPEENKMMMGEKNDFELLYQFLNLDISWFKPPLSTSLAFYAEALGQCRSILVHNRVSNKDDLTRVANQNIFWCFCPNANLFIENGLPDFEIFQALKSNICLGTDSLASNQKLDLVNEANTILKNTSTFSPEELLRAITYNGAAALGILDFYGQLILGKNTGLNLIRFVDSQIQFIKKIN